MAPLVLPRCQQLVLLSVQAELQGLIGGAVLSHALRGVHVRVEAVVAVGQGQRLGFHRGAFSVRPWLHGAKTLS